MKFEELGLAESLLQAVAALGYQTPTPIQAAAIPPVLENRDVLGCAQTGTGKTAAFALPILQRLGVAESRVNGRGRKIRALILAPTRELSLQISESFKAYGRHTKLRGTTIFGGVGQGPQVRSLNHGVDVVVATPGRLLDLMQQGFVDLSHVEVLVLDEADRMLDMGFIHDLRRIVADVPKKRQTLLFSATMPDSIRQLANQWLNNPVDVRVDPVSSPVEKIQQSVFFVDQPKKLGLLTHWLQETPWHRTLVFTRTKHGADKVVKHLVKAGIDADAFHSNKSQSARQRILARFRAPRPSVLVATDIAARGLDIEKISHVVNFDLPMDAEDYIHRIGRTGRAGADGIAISFCDHTERATLQSIQRLTRRALSIEAQPEGLPPLASTPERSPAKNPSTGRPKGRPGAAPSSNRYFKKKPTHRRREAGAGAR